VVIIQPIKFGQSYFGTSPLSFCNNHLKINIPDWAKPEIAYTISSIGLLQRIANVRD
jgi:hypothetical protein